MDPLNRLKLSIFFSVFLIGGIGEVIAQKGLHVGGAFGGHNSWLVNQGDRADERLQKRFTPGGSGGLYIAYYIKSGVAVAAEGSFSFQGQNYYFDGRYGDHRSSTRLAYFKAPLMLEFRTSISNGAFIKGHFGPYVSMLQAASRSREGDPVSPRSGYVWEQAYRSPLFGVMLGVGPGIRWGRRGWASTLEFRFDHDLTNAEEKGSPMIPNFRDETYNSTLGLLIRIRYAFQEQSAKAKSGYP